MNIIKQLKDADGNNIYPIAYAQGGVKWDLLWTNPQPTTSRKNFTISLDNSYDLYLVIYISDCTGGTVYDSSMFVLDGHQYTMLYIATGGGRYNRGLTASSSGDIIIGQGNYNGSENNVAAMPEYIYGLKSSWIVPTVVQGLQYVEV